MKSILVTNTGDKIHSKALAARKDIHVTFITETRFKDMYDSTSDVIWVDNLNDPANSTKSVLDQRNCNHYDAVISLSERAAPTAAYLRDYLGLQGASFYTITNCTNKFAMKQRFLNNGIAVSNYSLANNFNDVLFSAKEIGYPIIIKPVIGAGVDATMVFQNENDIYSNNAKEYFNRLNSPITTSEKEFPVIVEKFQNVINEYHCDGYVINGEVVFAQVSQYLSPVIDYASNGIYGSFSLHSSEPVSNEIVAMHKKAVKAVGIENGVTHFEVLHTPNGYIAGEIACRPGGGGIRKMLQFLHGFDSWDAHLAVSMAESYNWKNTNRTSEKQILELMLPTKRGKVTTISNAEDFNSIPGLLEVDMKIEPGNVVDGLLDSSAISGNLFIEYEDQSEIEGILTEVEKCFVLEVEPLNIHMKN
ncbi:ATP-grasp domain-containing protein [Fictibacillus nanhaiensis]|uniref:ATP-grasp domain-containing protein n=1 Tax=Fictibacillus nanhaiensis TaxID=742169 RepID=A0ABS2ZMZ0_9BACL|nr:ATP-grasp domain-containing protein [Fictibacillus nanhaiensis]